MKHLNKFNEKYLPKSKGVSGKEKSKLEEKGNTLMKDLIKKGRDIKKLQSEYDDMVKEINDIKDKLGMK